MANLVKRVIDKPCSNKYLLAVDGTLLRRNPVEATQKGIIKAISEGMSTGNIHSVNLDDVANET